MFVEELKPIQSVIFLFPDIHNQPQELLQVALLKPYKEETMTHFLQSLILLAHEFGEHITEEPATIFPIIIALPSIKMRIFI